uniref:Uncharacterized protein n=1 Tax=viral metagenome TaxID=1070528 RepID=A0A6C0DQ35_9ZZZZ
MFELPIEVQQLIYEFDNTYQNIFRNCLLDIQYRNYMDYGTVYKRIKINNSYTCIETFILRGTKPQNRTLSEINKKRSDYLFNKQLIYFYIYYRDMQFDGLYSWWNKIRECIKAISFCES